MKKVTFVSPYELFRLDIDEIMAIEARGNYSVATLRDGEEIVITKQLGQVMRVIEEQTPEENTKLARLGRSLTINLNYVRHICLKKKPYLTLRCTENCISRDYNPPKDSLKPLMEAVSC